MSQRCVCQGFQRDPCCRWRFLSTFQGFQKHGKSLDISRKTSPDMSSVSFNGILMKNHRKPWDLFMDFHEFHSFRLSISKTAAPRRLLGAPEDLRPLALEAAGSQNGFWLQSRGVVGGGGFLQRWRVLK